MPKPKKNESKQSFLNRCTKELIEKEDKDSDQAYAMCNSYWDESSQARASMSLMLDMELAEGDNKKRTFKITAYTGQRISRFFGDVIIDVAGMKAKNSIPVLREHERDRIVGHSRKAWKENNQFYLSGDVSEATPDGREIAALADEGFPWQASVGIFGRKIEFVDTKITAEVNGQTVEGPIDIWRESLVGEVSFVALGADDNTAAIVLSDGVWDNTAATYVQTSDDINLNEEGEDMKITLEVLEKEAPELLNEIRETARSEVTIENFAEDLQAKINKSVEDERGRVMDVFKQAYGDEAAEKFAKIVNPGATMEDMMTFAKENAKAEMLAKMQAESPESLGTGEDTGEETVVPEGEEKWKKEFAKSADLQAEFGNEARFLAFKKAESEGLVRVLRKKTA